MWHFRECQHHGQARRIIPLQYLCAHGGGLEIPNPEFASSWQGKRLIRTHTPLLVTLPASLAQHATLDLNVFFFLPSICWMCCDVWAAVEKRDWFNKKSVSEEGAAAQQQLTQAQRWPRKVVQRLLHGATFCWALSYTWLHIKRN